MSRLSVNSFLAVGAVFGFILPRISAQAYLYNTTNQPWIYPFDYDGEFDVAEENEQTQKERDRRMFQSSELRLMHYLVGNYDNSVRPVFDANQAVDIRLGLTLTQILDLDEKNQVLTTNVWLEAEWYDQRLNWSSSDFEGVTSIRIPCHKLWLPDIVLYNSVDDYTSGYMPSLVMVYNSSRVFWGPVIRFRSSCQIDITFFPFDTQVCKLKMGSWAYTGLQVNVWNSSHTMDLSNLVDNGEWELLGVAVKRNVVFYNCCKEPFPDVTFSIQLRRRTKYYFMNIIIPCIILSFLCLGGFLLPPESGEKITLGLSVLLTITVFMLMVADKMPQTSESISVISIYLMVVLATSCLSVLSSVLVLSIHHQRGKPSRAPHWLRHLCFFLVAKMLRLTQVRVTYAAEFQRSPVASAQKQRSASESKTCCQPCRYSNCASPVAMNRRETRYGPGKYKIANSCADGYIEMRAQFHHDTTGNDPKAAQENSCTEYHKVDFIPVHHQSERNCSGHTQGKCPCYTSRVYVSELHDCGSSNTFNRTGGGHRTFPSLDDHDAHPALRGIQQANTLDCFVPGGKQSPCSLPTVKSHLPRPDSKSIRFDCGNDLNNQKSRAGCCCLQESKGDSDKKPGCGKCKDDTVYHNVSDVERGQEELAAGDNESEHYDDNSHSESVSEEEVDPELLTVPRSELVPVKLQSQQQGTLSKGLPFSSHDQQSGQPQATNVIQTTSASGSKPPVASSTYRTILRYLLNLIEIRQEQEVSEIKDEELFREWHDIAFVLDRLLFYLFFLVTLVSTVCILEMRPETEPL